MQTEVSAVPMTLKIITGEQIIAYVVTPNPELLMSPDFRFDKFVYAFFPAKAELISNNEVKLSTFMPLSSNAVYPISFNDLVIATQITDNGLDLYTEWLSRRSLTINDVIKSIEDFFGNDTEIEDNVKISEEMAKDILSKFSGKTRH